MNLASVSRENPFWIGFTAVMSANNQALFQEKAGYANEKVDNNHQMAAMHR
ncbi:hypothetical protein [Pseudomonas sp. BF-R-26]|uniref:hypothetical protein n=1 Tax=Pseudomonas sp. BF-R-26 TaxID=2832398 RepID=UPI001CBDBEEA|nr:hypothetical protein [Pseudomonas sp. BF-R-26]